MDPATFRVTVEDGIVTLDSSPATEAVAREIAERARHIEGVVAVRERPTAIVAGFPHRCGKRRHVRAPAA